MKFSYLKVQKMGIFRPHGEVEGAINVQFVSLKLSCSIICKYSEGNLFVQFVFFAQNKKKNNLLTFRTYLHYMQIRTNN